MAFPADESWVVLSPIEASIKRKIEAVGTPLREWDISINYGIKTGCNEAFIIPTSRRDEILAACRDEAERERTAALIRPNNLRVPASTPTKDARILWSSSCRQAFLCPCIVRGVRKRQGIC